MKKYSYIYFLLVFFLSLSAAAQEDVGTQQRNGRKKAKLLKVNFFTQKAAGKSVLRGASSGSCKASDWGIVEVLYESYEQWLDELSFTYQVLFYNKDLREKEVSKKFMLLNDKVTYLNVPAGKNKHARIYIHPDAIARYGEVMGVRVVIAAKGISEELNESYANKKERNYLGKWWEKTDFPSKKGSMLKRFYTPFIFEGNNASEMIKTK